MQALGDQAQARGVWGLLTDVPSKLLADAIEGLAKEYSDWLKCGIYSPKKAWFNGKQGNVQLVGQW